MQSNSTSCALPASDKRTVIVTMSLCLQKRVKRVQRLPVCPAKICFDLAKAGAEAKAAENSPRQDDHKDRKTCVDRCQCSYKVGVSADNDAAVKQSAVLSMCFTKSRRRVSLRATFETELVSKDSHAQIAREEFAHGLSRVQKWHDRQHGAHELVTTAVSVLRFEP